MTELYHYTCEHGRAELGDTGELLPVLMLAPDSTAWLPWAPYVWMTDLGVPVREVLGLTMTATACDRTRYRYRVVDASDVRPWAEVRREHRKERWPARLEGASGARPMHWFVSRSPVPVVFDPVP